MHLKLLPVHSKIADPETIPYELDKALPNGWQLSQHQVDTFEALRNPKYDVVVNIAMTGDGKSLAGQLPTLVDGWRMMALYPTNELLVDQALNLTSTLERWKKQISYEQLFGARLDELTETAQQRRSDEVLRLLTEHKIVLSNPDIWHLALQSVYRGGGAPTLIASKMRNTFGLFTFDEFHLYNQPQIGAVLSGLLFMLATKGQYSIKALLLSATPSPLFQTAFETLGWADRVHIVRGTYQYGHNSDPKLWRTILQAVDLHWHTALSRDEGGIEQWMATTGKERLLKFFADQPFVKGAIIVNSVASAKRILDLVREPLAAIGKTAETCTGLDSTAIRAKARNADVLIGTATVDVGVDFQINFLIFEASDAGNAIQRLGRIGRHTHYTDENKQRHAFEQFEAHAIVPSFVYTRLFVQRETQQPAYFQANPHAVERSLLNEAILSAFPSQQQFSDYLRIWGRFQPARVIATLNDSAIRTDFADSRELLRQQYGNVFKAPMYKTANEAERDEKTSRKFLIREARSFRGSSPFQCGVINQIESNNQLLPSTVGYDLLWLLSNTKCEWISDEEFRRSTSHASAFLRGHHIGFVRVHAMRSKYNSLSINLAQADCDWQTPERAQPISGIQLECEDVETMYLIQKAVRALTVPAWFCVGLLPDEVRRRKNLPGQFRLYTFHNTYHQGTIAFGRDALLLDSVSYKPMGDTPAALLF